MCDYYLKCVLLLLEMCVLSFINGPVTLGVDPESGKMNGGEGYDLTIIAAIVGVVVVLILFIVIGVKVYYSRKSSKKVSSSLLLLIT